MQGSNKILRLSATLTLLFSTALFAQNVDFEQLTIEHGLPHNMVYSIIQDSQGFLWIGTRDGPGAV